MVFDSPMELQVLVDNKACFSLLLERNSIGQLMITKFVTESADDTPKEFTIRANYETEETIKNLWQQK